MEYLQPISETNMLEGWLGVLISSTACVIGGKYDLFINIKYEKKNPH